MERAGTGGSLFRNLYRDFLIEVFQLTSLPELKTASDRFKQIAKQWAAVSECFFSAGETDDMRYINDASKLLVEISEGERSTMEDLANAFC